MKNLSNLHHNQNPDLGCHLLHQQTYSHQMKDFQKLLSIYDKYTRIYDKHDLSYSTKQLSLLFVLAVLPQHQGSRARLYCAKDPVMFLHRRMGKTLHRPYFETYNQKLFLYLFR